MILEWRYADVITGAGTERYDNVMTESQKLHGTIVV
jgi:hypothetical protein